MLKRLLAVSTAMLLTLATFAFAAELREDHPTRYVVQKGDTLWDISARFLKKPWLWPEIWQANPQVQNPHRIYPGDVLSLVYVDGQPRLTTSNAGGPQISSGPAVETIPLARIEPFLKQFTVVDEFKSLPYVLGIEEDRLRASAGQVVYVRGLANAQPGMAVQIARPMAEYRFGHKNGANVIGRGLDYRGNWEHRDWDNLLRRAGAKRQGEKAIGYELMRHGYGEVTQVQGEIALVVLRDETRDVRVGDRILPVESQPYDPYYYPHAPASVPEHAQVMAAADGIEFSGPNQVVAISAGSSDGLKNGDTFSIWHDGVIRGDHVADASAARNVNDKVTMPDDYIGRVMVFRTFNKMSYGLVMESIRPTRVGDLLKHPDATQ